YYDPATAQFISRDPAVALTRQPYGYVHGSPLDNIDPTGLVTFGYCVGFSITLGIHFGGSVCTVSDGGQIAITRNVSIGVGGPAAVSATLTAQASDASSVQQLAGNFADIGVSAGALGAGSVAYCLSPGCGRNVADDA